MTLNFLLVTIGFFSSDQEEKKKNMFKDNNKSYSDILDRNMLE